MTQLGQLHKVELRDAWETEDRHFTPWLAEENNLKILADTVNLDLELEAVEKNVGPFRAAMDWLNKTTGDDFKFFGLEIELWKFDRVFRPIIKNFNLDDLDIEMEAAE